MSRHNTVVLYRFINTGPQNTTDKECLQKQGDSLIILTVVASPLKSMKILNFRSGIQNILILTPNKLSTLQKTSIEQGTVSIQERFPIKIGL